MLTIAGENVKCPFEEIVLRTRNSHKYKNRFFFVLIEGDSCLREGEQQLWENLSISICLNWTLQLFGHHTNQLFYMYTKINLKMNKLRRLTDSATCILC